VQFTYSSVSIHFVLVGAPFFLHRFVCVCSDVLSLDRIVPKLVSAHQGQRAIACVPKVEFQVTFGLNTEDKWMYSQSKEQHPQRIALLSSLARQQHSPASHHVELPTIYGVNKSRCRGSMLADSFQYLSSRYCVEGIRCVDSRRNLIRNLPKLLHRLADSMHNNVRPYRGNCGDLMWQQVVFCER
jgi:hypothetical protein